MHLKDFLREWLKEGKFETDPNKFLDLSDIEVLAAIREESKNGSETANIIANRQHFKVAYYRNPGDQMLNIEASKNVSLALAREFGEDNVRLDSYEPRGSVIDFPVLQPDLRVVSSTGVSDLLQQIPTAVIGYVFVKPSIRTKAQQFVSEKRETILTSTL